MDKKSPFNVAVLMVGILCFGSLVLAQGEADAVFTNGKIYTVNTTRPFVEAVAIKNGKFLEVGSARDIAEYVGKRTRVVDLGGAFAMPGFIDAHIHPAQPYLNEEGGALLFPESSSKEQIAEAVAAYLKKNQNAPYIVGERWAQRLFPNRRANKEWLDSMISDRPAILRDETRHGVSNSSQTAISCREAPIFKFNNVFNPNGVAYGGACQAGINGNISADPLFSDPSKGDYSLKAGSPSIEAGQNTVPELPTMHFDGAPRILDGDGGGQPVIDMGVYEFNPTGLLQFSSRRFSAGEKLGSALVTITRKGGSKGTVTINLNSSDGTATTDLDYAPISETLIFNDGEAAAIRPAIWPINSCWAMPRRTNSNCTANPIRSGR